MTALRVLWAVAVLAAAGGIALRLAPARVADAAAAAPLGTAGAAAPESRQPAAVDAARFEAVVATNPFSERRTPPAVRFVPEGMRRDTQPAARPATKPAVFEPRLFGISRGPGGAVALIDADPAVPGAEVYQEGDEVKGGRVERIDEATVVLSRRGGRLVLRLPVGEAGR